MHPLVEKTFILGVITFLVHGCALANGYSVAYVLLILASLATFYKSKKLNSYYKMSAWDWALFISMTAMVLISFAVSLYYGESGRYFDRPSKILIGLLFVYCLRFVEIKRWLFILCIQCGAIVFGVFAIQDVFFFNLERAQGGMLEIHFGNFALVWGLGSLLSLFHLHGLKNKKIFIGLGILGFVMGIFASILSGSRGGWIYVPMGFVLVSLFSFKSLKHSLLLIFSSFVFVVVAAFSAYHYSPAIKERVDMTYETLFKDLSEIKVLDTSITARFEMWYLASEMIKVHPIIGWGDVQYLKFMKWGFLDGHISQKVYKHRHPHNEYLNEFVKRGIFGFLALISLYLISFAYFFKNARSNYSSEVKLPAGIGAIFVSGYMVFGLTQAVFSHNEGTMYWILGVGIFWALTRYAENSHKSSELIPTHSDATHS
ncbi:O-antigen ligase family protein [Taylorella equigenitalis]|uniref:O-antigen ligase family protein n=1 Tax=Taylorella equigenitalis TaxID=29575 RepID=UPI000419BBC7|nr:O-antigen ligase family protein [Taylorella equigenitalis]ASY30875.1 ligase [Taylorella equigenitalis]KOS59486.1 ligase [Taylorella equigenitalis]